MVEAILASIIGPVIVALVTAGPAYLAARRAGKAATGAHEAAKTATAVAAESGPSTVEVLSSLRRLEGKVDVIRRDVRTLMDWRAVHDARHASLGLAEEFHVEE